MSTSACTCTRAWAVPGLTTISCRGPSPAGTAGMIRLAVGATELGCQSAQWADRQAACAARRLPGDHRRHAGAATGLGGRTRADRTGPTDQGDGRGSEGGRLGGQPKAAAGGGYGVVVQQPQPVVICGRLVVMLILAKG